MGLLSCGRRKGRFSSKFIAAVASRSASPPCGMRVEPRKPRGATRMTNAVAFGSNGTPVAGSGAKYITRKVKWMARLLVGMTMARSGLRANTRKVRCGGPGELATLTGTSLPKERGAKTSETSHGFSTTSMVK